ncbi:unnamed protein product [Fraxinus pennsylvanica]|uniref:Uncharacterized protein n=1 Tax=Fraxinus pennsylvanica TaxID=56036 RepID=A0AAD2DRW4_9LAMI|nr:unnamed protein product [Fraxinus pennsylvanica]
MVSSRQTLELIPAHLSFLKGSYLSKYFSSEWSFAQFHLPECTRFMTAFGTQDTVIIVGMDGSFYRCSFDPVNGGPMVQQEHVLFLKTETRPRQGYRYLYVMRSFFCTNVLRIL